MKSPRALPCSNPWSPRRKALAAGWALVAATALLLQNRADAAGGGAAAAPAPPADIALPVGTAKPGAPTKAANAAPGTSPAPATRGDPYAVAERIKAVVERHRGSLGGAKVMVGDELVVPTSQGRAPPRSNHRVVAAIRSGHAAPEAHGGTAAKGHDPHWSYEGANGPEHWARVKPEFNICAIGKRQSPVHIQESGTLQGPAEPLQFDYRPTGGSVVNNGHTIQVDLEPGNTLSVRGTSYELLQFHFHHPSEERVNHRGFAMVAHLVHRSHEGQLAVVAVLIDPGAANGLIHKVWTHMPLDSGDRVPLPAGLIDLRELLPADQRYYQFMGSLTTPPCTEGVLWNVLKSPVTVSREQLKLFSQIFPNNARPVQALNGRAVRDAQ
jgi:carbonic anhydrase